MCRAGGELCSDSSPLPAARVLAVSGGEGLPRGGALRQGGHQHSRQRVPRGEIGTIFKVELDLLSAFWGLDVLPASLVTSLFLLQAWMEPHGPPQ